jgi:hypothetical protein
VKSLWVNLKKPKRVMSHLTFNEHMTYEAQSVSTGGYTEYIKADDYETLVQRAKELKKKKASKSE